MFLERAPIGLSYVSTLACQLGFLEFDNQIICKKVFKEEKDDKSIESALAVSDNIGGISVKKTETNKQESQSLEKSSKSETSKASSTKKASSGNTTKKNGNNKTRN